MFRFFVVVCPTIDKQSYSLCIHLRSHSYNNKQSRKGLSLQYCDCSFILRFTTLLHLYEDWQPHRTAVNVRQLLCNRTSSEDLVHPPYTYVSRLSRFGIYYLEYVLYDPAGIPTGYVLWIVFAHVQFQAIDTVTNGQEKAPIILLNLDAKLIHYSNSIDL